MSAHFEAAGNAALAHRHAVAAAQEAAALSAHTEAFDLYRRALRNLPGLGAVHRTTSPAPGASADGLPAAPTAAEHAALLAALADEAAAVDDNAAALIAYQQAQTLWLAEGDVLAAAAKAPCLANAAHLLGHGLADQIEALRSRLDAVVGIPGSEPVQAQDLAAVSAVYMLDRRLDEAIEYGERGLRLCDAPGDRPGGAPDTEPTRLNTSTTLGSVLVFAGQAEQGWQLLETAIERAESRHLEAEAARGHRMIGSCASVLVEYDRAEPWLRRGIAYADQVELFNHRNYMAAHLAHVQWATGDWTAARDTADRALADGQGGLTTRITALYVLGYLALGRGEHQEAAALLEEALGLGEAMGELQRLSPPLWGLAESARLREDWQTTVTLCERGYEASAKVDDAAYLFPFLLTGVRAYSALGDPAAAEEWRARITAALRHRAIPGTLPALDHATGLIALADGDATRATEAFGRAAEGWQARRRFWEGAWLLLDQAAAARRLRRHGEATRLITCAHTAATGAGATSLADAADRIAAAHTHRTDPAAAARHPLTAREHEVALLVARGLTNRQIAAELFITPKTASAHVEHILAKLGAARRAEIAAWVGGMAAR